MEKINFEDLPSTKTPIDSKNLNLLQTNVENAIQKSNNYSLDEIIVGTWIDGSTLYRKIVKIVVPTTTTDGNYVWSRQLISSDLKFGLIEWSYLTDSSSNNVHLPYMTNSGFQVKDYVENSTKQVVLTNGYKAYNGLNAVICVLYTKNE